MPRMTRTTNQVVLWIYVVMFFLATKSAHSLAGFRSFLAIFRASQSSPLVVGQQSRWLLASRCGGDSSEGTQGVNRNRHLLDSQNSSSLFNDHDKRIFLHLPKHGFRTEPFSWQELQDICQGPHADLSRLSRSVEIEYQYALYRRQLNQNWKSIYDHVLCSKFQFETKRDKASGKQYANPSLLEIKNELRRDNKSLLVVVPNEFPYYVADNVEHWVLWKLGGDEPCTEEEIAQAKETLKQKKEKQGAVVKDYIHWTNPLHLKSLPDIDHAHILCLLEKSR